MRKIIYCSLLMFVLFATGAIADCNDDSNNFMQTLNCDFTNNITGWTLPNGTLSHDPTDDFLGVAPGAVIINSNIVAGGSELNRCVALSDLTAKTVGIWIKGELNAGSCLITVSTSNDSTCTSGAFNTSTNSLAFTDATPWTNLNVNIPALAPGTGSVLFKLLCGNSGSGLEFSLKADNAFIVAQGGLPVELQLFSVD